MINFRKISEHLLPIKVNRMRINPAMDIVAIELTTSDIIINRIFSWQRVWFIPKPKIQSNNDKTIEIIDMAWSHDGKMLAVAYNQPIIENNENESANNYLSSIVLYMIETTQKVFVHNLEYDVTCLIWQVKCYPDNQQQITSSSSTTNIKPINLDELKLPLDSLNVPYIDLFITDNELLNYPFKSNSKSANVNSKFKFHNQLPPLVQNQQNSNEYSIYDHMNSLNNRTINILSIGTKQNVIFFYLNGHFKILKLNVEKFNIDYTKHIDRLWLSPDFNSIQIYFNSVNNSSLLILEMKLFENLWKEIFLVNRIRLNIDLRLESLNDIIKDICSIWSDVIVDIESRLSNYEFVDLIKKNDTEEWVESSNDNKIKLKFGEFIDMLIFGNISLNLERFFHDMNRKDTSKLYFTFEHCLDNICRLIITKLVNTLSQLSIYVDNLRGMSLNDLQFEEINLSIELINQLRREIVWMMEKCNILMTKMDNLKFKMLAATRMIYKGIYMSQHTSFDHNNGSNNDRNNEYLKFFDHDIGRMTLQDFHMLMAFFNSNNNCNDFEYFLIEQILDANYDSQSSSPSKLTTTTSENIKNPYKTYQADKNMQKFYEILNDLNINDEEICINDLINKMFHPFNETKFNNIPDDCQNSSKKWFEQLLMNDISNIDAYDENYTLNWTLLEHLQRISSIKKRIFDESYEKMNELQSKLIDNEIAFKFYEKNEELCKQKPFEIDCFNNILNNCIYVAKFHDSNNETTNQSIIAIYRIEKSIFSRKRKEQMIQMIQFELIANCRNQFNDCNCDDDKFNLIIEDFKFYDTDLLTMIITEYHPKSMNQKRNQYLLQCKYSKMFDAFENEDNNYIEYLINDKKLTNQSLKIDISTLIDRVWNMNENDELFMKINGKTFISNDNFSNEIITIDEFFKIRCLNNDKMDCNIVFNDANDQKQRILRTISVNGQRNLSCCLDNNNSYISAFEMDVCEDVDEENDDVIDDDDDGDGNVMNETEQQLQESNMIDDDSNIQMAESVEMNDGNE